MLEAAIDSWQKQQLWDAIKYGVYCFLSFFAFTLPSFDIVSLFRSPALARPVPAVLPSPFCLSIRPSPSECHAINHPHRVPSPAFFLPSASPLRSAAPLQSIPATLARGLFAPCTVHISPADSPTHHTHPLCPVVPSSSCECRDSVHPPFPFPSPCTPPFLLALRARFVSSLPASSSSIVSPSLISPSPSILPLLDRHCFAGSSLCFSSNPPSLVPRPSSLLCPIIVLFHFLPHPPAHFPLAFYPCNPLTLPLLSPVYFSQCCVRFRRFIRLVYHLFLYPFLCILSTMHACQLESSAATDCLLPFRAPGDSH
ncbi:hypothetical protein B0H17DRAFT_1074259, partial [Mycena rosella]